MGVNIKKISRSEQILIVVAVAVIGTFFYVKYVYDPTSRNFTFTQKKHERLAEEVTSLRFQVTGGVPLKAMKQQVEKANKDLRKAESSLPGSGARADASMEIVRVASKYDFDIKTYEPDYKPKKAEKLYKRRYINMVLSGDFCGLISFLDEVRGMPSLVLVERAVLSRGEKAGFVEMELLLSV